MAAVNPDETDALTPPEVVEPDIEAPEALLPLAEPEAEAAEADDAEALVMDMPEAEADDVPPAAETLAARLERGGREMEEVAEPRLTETEPDVTTWLPHRADWSWTEVCCSAAVQLAWRHAPAAFWKAALVQTQEASVLTCQYSLDMGRNDQEKRFVSCVERCR